jgi:hypothetical protein
MWSLKHMLLQKRLCGAVLPFGSNLRNFAHSGHGAAFLSFNEKAFAA